MDQAQSLNPRDASLYRWASALAQANLIQNLKGQDVAVAAEVDGLRRWMLEAICPLVPLGKQADVLSLRELAPSLAMRVHKTRALVLGAHQARLGPADLDRELGQKKLVLVLGGGGGSGLAHLGLFAALNDLELTPHMIVGSSMGGVMGALRAINKVYDPVATALAFPNDMPYNAMFRPFSGYSRFGFPGAFHINLIRLARGIFQQLTGHSVLRFSDLPIPLQVVVSGIRIGFQLDDDDYTSSAAASSQTTLTPLALRRKLRLFFSAVKQMTQNPRLLTQVVFGKEEGTEDFPIIDAIGFSCAVPGLFHYDVYHDDPETIEPLEALFAKHKLLRLCDGGIINNVPSQVAWDSVQEGTIASRNAFILAADPFAPISTTRNLIWMPIQQIAKQNVGPNKPYADYHKTFLKPPSPLQLLVGQYSRIKAIVRASKAELEADKPYIKQALAPTGSYDSWAGHWDPT